MRAAGGVAAVLNTRHATVKERGWADKAPSEAEFVRAAVEEPNVIRRPIFVQGKSVLVGYDKSNKDRWAKVK